MTPDQERALDIARNLTPSSNGQVGHRAIAAEILRAEARGLRRMAVTDHALSEVERLEAEAAELEQAK